MTHERQRPRKDRSVTGFHAIEEALARSDARGVLYLSRSGPRHRELEGLARARGAEVRRAAEAELDRLAGGRDHRGAVLIAPPSDRTAALGEALAAAPDASLVVVLDGITDPRNLGAILRSAEQFSADLVVLPRRRSAPITSAVETASAGAVAHLKIVTVANLVRSFDSLRERGFWIYGAHLEGEPLDRVDLGDRAAFVLGSEGGGLSRLVAERVDALVRIPTTGRVDSLNVSVAAGILLYEFRRRGAPSGR